MIKLNKYFLLCFALLASQFLLAQEEDFRKKAPEAGPAPSIEMGAYEQFTLENGLQVIVVENHKLPRVSFQLYIDVPLIKEGKEAGMTALAGEMLSRGTTSRSKAEIDQAIDFIGADFSTDENGMYGACLTKHQARLLEVMSDVLLQPAFSQEEFEKVQSQRLSELALAQSNASSIADKVGQAVCFDEHPYGEVVSKSSLENITVEKCKNYYETYFKPNISYLAIVGDIDLKKAKEVAEKYFGAWKKGQVDKGFFERSTPPESTEVNFVHKDGAVQSVINITYPVNLKPGTEDAIIANVLNTMLGGGMLNSRLNKNIREDKGYSYGVGSTLRYDKYVGYFEAGGSVRNEVTDSAVAEFLMEMNRLRDEPVAEKELKSVQSYIFGSFARSLENPQTVARFALNTLRYKLPKDYYANYLKRVDATTAEELQAAARKYILPGQAHIVVVGNKGEVADQLNRFDRDGKVRLYDTDGNLIEASAMAIPEGTTAESIVRNYIEVIGGEKKLREVKDMTVEMSTTVQGMAMAMNLQRKSPDKYLMKVEMNGAVLNETKFDGEEGYVSAMGQKEELKDQDLEDLRAQAELFPELNYLADDYELELAGIEKVEGKNAYHVVVTMPSGSQVDEYYEQESGYKIKYVVTRTGPGGAAATVSNQLADYREIEGIKIPYEITTEGMAPFPIKLEVKSATVNTGLEDSLFEIE